MPTSRKILVAGALLFLLSGLFPPWVYTYDRNGDAGGHTQKPAGYKFIFSPPSPETHPQYSGLNIFFGVRVDFSRLLIQWSTIGGLVGFCLFLSSNSKP